MDSLRILPLGGLGEIGINSMLLEWRDEMVLIDCGVQFPDSSYPGVEQFTPDLSYVRDRAEKLKGVVVTHGHDDHIGALPYLCRDVDGVNIYSTSFPRGLITHKLTEHGLLGSVEFHQIEPRKPFKVGSFTFDPIPVQHSIVEALGFGIETPVGNVVHSGDFKHDPTEVGGKIIGFEPFEEWGKKGVHLLFSDSTNAESVGHTLSEEDIASSFERFFTTQKGRIFVGLFASNIRRVEKLLGIAHSLGKKIAFVGRSMHGYSRLAHEQGLLKIPENTLVLAENLGDHPNDQVIVLATGSQAEPQSALVRMAYGTHKDLHIREGDAVMLSSRFIPGNERAITDMINQLCRLGADVFYESIHQIHVSGHGFQDELKLMLNAVKPKHFVPVHGEYRHLSKHARIAKDTGVSEDKIFVIEDGQTLEVTKDKVALGEHIPLTRSVIVQGNTMNPTPTVFSERMGMSKAGIVFCALLRDPKTRKLRGRPVLGCHGLLFCRGENEEDSIEGVMTHLEKVYPHYSKNGDAAEQTRLEIRRYLKKKTIYKPIVITTVIDI